MQFSNMNPPDIRNKFQQQLSDYFYFILIVNIYKLN